MSKVLIVGGGASGLAAAVELSNRSVRSVIVERGPTVGGLANGLGCKGAPVCVRCDACRPADLRREAALSPLVRIMAGAVVIDAARNGRGYRATVETPEGLEHIDADAVILAVGAVPYDPDADPRLRHRECADILSSLEVEMALAGSERLVVPSTGAEPRDMAIIQCVGSRDVRRGAPYCSKACCKYGQRLGRRLRHLYPEMRLVFFFMDWRPLEDAPDALDAWAAGDERTVVVRSRPSEVLGGEHPVVRYATQGESVAEDAFDIVMLTVGMLPGDDNPRLAEAFGIGLDEHGFLVSDRGEVIVAGACGGPMDLRESIEEGIAAAGRAWRHLEGGE
ncbi:MAG: CoB--CoM heterodisulfide reductase iron-sulfur subunit A family protein [Methanomassiliicoccus sp.]|nr:CoB--CoM heterodisulfide reductase iron-sulfur subunit A family protein [Methanomassiliicoccus sp.]